jgi:hypothetical protein
MPDFSVLSKVPRELVEGAVRQVEGALTKLLEGRFQAAWSEHGPIGGEEGRDEPNLVVLSCREYFDGGCRAALDLMLQPKAQRKLGLQDIEESVEAHGAFQATRKAAESWLPGVVGWELAVCYFNEGVRYALGAIKAKAKEQGK